MNPVTRSDIVIVRPFMQQAAVNTRFSTWQIEAEAVGSRYDITATYDRVNRRLVVALVNFRTCWEFNSTVHWDYVAEKLNLSRPDAQAVALIINEIHEEIRASCPSN